MPTTTTYLCIFQWMRFVATALHTETKTYQKYFFIMKYTHFERQKIKMGKKNIIKRGKKIYVEINIPECVELISWYVNSMISVFFLLKIDHSGCVHTDFQTDFHFQMIYQPNTLRFLYGAICSIDFLIHLHHASLHDKSASVNIYLY